MQVERADIQDRCTDAVFERGENYRSEGLIGRLARFGDRVTADVQGSRSYDVTVDFGPTPFETTCTCPYGGPGICKHVVAVLLDIVESPPSDERPHVKELLEELSQDALRSFLLDEVERDSELRDRFRARFDEERRSVSAYRDEIDQLFDEQTIEYPVVTEAIDFSHWFEQAERYRSRERYREAATVYRAIATGVEENSDRIDAAYDHYARVFQRALDGYVECLKAAEVTDSEFRDAVSVLSERAEEAVGPYGERYRDALATLTNE